jgi:PAS domain S-box-containing protein
MAGIMKRREDKGPGAVRLVALLALLSVVPLALLAYSSVHLASGAVRREVETRLSSNAALSATAILEEMDGLGELVESYAQRPALIDGLTRPGQDVGDDLVPQLTELRLARPGIATAFLAAPDGTLLEIVPATPSIIGNDFSFRDWYRGVTSTGLTYLSEAYQSQATGHPTVVATATLVRAPGEGTTPGPAIGILVAAYDLGTIQAFVNEFSASQGVALTVTDQRGTLVAAPGAAPTGLSSRRSDPMVASALHGGSGVTTWEGPDGRNLTAYAPIPRIGWTVTASVPERQGLVGVVRLRSTVLLIAGLLLMALLAGLILLDRALRARRRAEEESREASALVDSIVESIPHMIFVKDAEELRFVRFNRAGEDLLGLPRDSLLGMSDDDFFPAEQAAFFKQKDREVLASGLALDIPEEPIDTPSGRRYLHTRKIPIVAADGIPDYLLGISEDITEHKMMQDAVRESEERYRLLVETAKDMVFTYAPDGTFTSLNSGFEAITGWDRRDWIGKPFAPLVHPDDLPAASERSARLLRGENLPPFEVRLSSRGGGWVTAESVATPMVDDGKVVQVLGIVRDITERKQAEEEIRRAKDDAERSRDEAQRARDAADQANRAKSEFLSRMSHELRTPLNAVLGFGQLLEMDELNDDQRESVHQILKGGKHLLDLINEVLDISRIEVGRLSLSMETVSVRDALEEAIDLVRPLAGDVGVDLHQPVVEAASYVLADRQRLKQVLLNLLSNGVKYNRPGGTLTVRCRQMEAEGCALIEVTDEGSGIAAEHMERLFTPFDRLGAERTGVEGTGLGLALSKRLVEAMGGSVGVVSAPGVGTTFSVRLSLAQEIDVPLDEATMGRRAMDGLPDGGATLLYIEDNAANLKLIERVLGEHSGLELLVALQASIGLDLARQHQPDLILLDLHLPDMRGDEVLMSLKADPRTRDIPVVMISADATESQIRKLLAEGARAYLTKPLDVRKFLETIKGILIEGRLDHAG